MLTKPLRGLGYEGTATISVTYAPAYTGEVVDFGHNLGRGHCSCWSQRSPSTDKTL